MALSNGFGDWLNPGLVNIKGRMVSMFTEVPAALDAQFGRAARQAPTYVGQSLENARRLAAAALVERIRVLSLDGDSLRMHQDHRPRRLNLLVLRDKVVRAAFF